MIKQNIKYDSVIAKLVIWNIYHEPFLWNISTGIEKLWICQKRIHPSRVRTKCRFFYYENGASNEEVKGLLRHKHLSSTKMYEEYYQRLNSDAEHKIEIPFNRRSLIKVLSLIKCLLIIRTKSPFLLVINGLFLYNMNSS